MTSLAPLVKYRTLTGHENSASALQIASTNKRAEIQAERAKNSTIKKVMVSYRTKYEQAQIRAIKAEKQLVRMVEMNEKLKDRIKVLKEKLIFIENFFLNIGDERKE